MRPRWCTWWCCPAVFGVFRSCRLDGGEIRQSTAQAGRNYTIPAEAGRKFQVSRVGEESLRTHAGERGRSPRSTAEAASGATVYRRGGVQTQFGLQVPRGPNLSAQTASEKPRSQERFPKQAVRTENSSPEDAVIRNGSSAARCPQIWSRERLGPTEG